MTLEEARRKVIQRVNSIDSQGCLPYDGVSLTGHVAMFDGVNPDLAAKAVWSLIDDGTLTFDKYTNLVNYPYG